LSLPIGLSTIRSADQILVVEQGQIVERGTHAELYAMRGRYYDLYTKQHGLESQSFLAPAKETMCRSQATMAPHAVATRASPMLSAS